MHNATVPTRILLDGGPVIDVDPTGHHLEVTIGCPGRARAGIALTRTEARRLAVALMDASAPSLATGDPAETREHLAAMRHTAPVDPFTDTFPSDTGDVPSVPFRTFASVPGHREPLGVTAIAEPHGTQVHVGSAVLNIDAARELVAHLSEIVGASR